MKKHILILLAILISNLNAYSQQKSYNNNNFNILTTKVKHISNLDITIWSINVKGKAGKTTPKKNGALDGAPVLGYVFPTTLKPTDVGFNKTEGIVALALTSHPDFDDTPLWDENNDQNYANDGVIWHPHWVILVKDKRVKGGLSVKQFKKADATIILPPTNPGMPMYMDSPGFQVSTKGNTIQVVIPDNRINHQTDFNFDGVTVFMKVNTSNKNLPMLGVYEVFSVSSKNLSLPYKVEKE
jgi:hypothetical protein